MNSATKVESEEHWHGIRARHVGGSEIASLFYTWEMPDGSIRFLHMFEEAPDGAALLGCASPYLTGFRLYHIKAGLLEPDDLDNERVLAGQFLEPAIAEWAKHKWNWNIRKVHRYLSPAPKSPGEIKEIRARAWATRRAKCYQQGHRRANG